MRKNKEGLNISKKNKKSFNIIEVVILMIITCFFGIFIGSIVTFVTIKTKDNTVIKEQSDKYIKQFTESYNNILDNYYDKVDKNKLIDSAIKGMIDYLDDPYASFMDGSESISFSEEVEGEYVGVGCEITITDDNQAIVSKIFENSPADKAGIKENDLIISINGKDVSNTDLTNLYELMKGKEKTELSLKIKRDVEIKEVTLIKEKIEIPSVTSSIERVNNKNIGIIKVDIFAANTYKQFRKTLLKLEKKNIDSLIIDVRDNNGGYLSTVTDIASIFLKKNKIIYQLSSKGIKEPILDLTKENRTYKVVVLVNEYSASSSEILAAALKESYNATLIGTKTFGKGTVQKAQSLTDGSIFKYTIQTWLTPKGNSIDKNGLTPDFLETDANKQMEKAIEILS